MKNIKTMQIWKTEEQAKRTGSDLETDIEELGLSVRSYNCLKRAGCHSVSQVMALAAEEGGLKKIRNLGMRSEAEIRAALEAFTGGTVTIPEKEKNTVNTDQLKERALSRPLKRAWDKRIEVFPISLEAEEALHACGVFYIRDLYDTKLVKEPGWFAVRELFWKMPAGIESIKEERG